jgi:thioredoxin-like negative regulator of GroEL
MSFVVELTENEWENMIEKGERISIVMFFSPFCQHCREMEPFFEKYAGEFKEKIMFAKLNVLSNQRIATRYGVMSTPTFKVFCHGKPVQEIVGEIYPTLLKKTVEEALEYGENCAKKSTLIDYSSGYA